VIEELNKLLRGWMQYFRLAEVKGVEEEAAKTDARVKEIREKAKLKEQK
jgi:Group II intron, maturase-specific domain